MQGKDDDETLLHVLLRRHKHGLLHLTLAEAPPSALGQLLDLRNKAGETLLDCAVAPFASSNGGPERGPAGQGGYVELVKVVETLALHGADTRASLALIDSSIFSDAAMEATLFRLVKNPFEHLMRTKVSDNSVDWGYLTKAFATTEVTARVSGDVATITKLSDVFVKHCGQRARAGYPQLRSITATFLAATPQEKVTGVASLEEAAGSNFSALAGVIRIVTSFATIALKAAANVQFCDMFANVVEAAMRDHLQKTADHALTQTLASRERAVRTVQDGVMKDLKLYSDTHTHTQKTGSSAADYESLEAYLSTVQPVTPVAAILQPEQALTRLLFRARLAAPGFRQKTTAVLATVSGLALSFRPGPKHPHRILEKTVMQRFGSPSLDCSGIFDVLGVLVSCASYAAAQQATKAIVGCPEWTLVRVENRFSSPTPTAWRHVALTVSFKGFLFELQVAHMEMAKVYQGPRPLTRHLTELCKVGGIAIGYKAVGGPRVERRGSGSSSAPASQAQLTQWMKTIEAEMGKLRHDNAALHDDNKNLKEEVKQLQIELLQARLEAKGDHAPGSFELDEGWNTAVDPESGKRYFYTTNGDEVRWDVPQSRRTSADFGHLRATMNNLNS